MSCYIPMLEKIKKFKKQPEIQHEWPDHPPPADESSQLWLQQYHFNPDPANLEVSDTLSVAKQIRRRDQKGLTITQQRGQFPHKVPLNIRHNHPTLGLNDVAFHQSELNSSKGVLTLGLPSQWTKPFKKQVQEQKIFQSASSDVIRQTYTTNEHTYETLKTPMKLAGSLPRRSRNKQVITSRPRSVHGQRQKLPEPYRFTTLTNRSSEDDEGIGACDSFSKDHSSFTSSTTGSRSSPDIPISSRRLQLLPNQGPPPRHLLPSVLKPSPAFKMHPLLPFTAVTQSTPISSPIQKPGRPGKGI